MSRNIVQRPVQQQQRPVQQQQRQKSQGLSDREWAFWQDILGIDGMDILGFEREGNVSSVWIDGQDGSAYLYKHDRSLDAATARFWAASPAGQMRIRAWVLYWFGEVGQ